jgi:hypothetical protein
MKRARHCDGFDSSTPVFLDHQHGFKMLPFDIRRSSRNAQPSLSKIRQRSKTNEYGTDTSRFGCFGIFRRVRFALA